MTDDNNELNKKVEKLENKIENLERKLEANTAKDKQHAEELKQIQQQQHKENLTWNRTGAILTPLMVAIIPFVIKYLDRRQDIKPQIKKDADDINEKMGEILKAIKENNSNKN